MYIRTDLHVHTIASGHAYSTISEIASAAGARGLEAVAITDHGPAMPGGAGIYHFWNLRVIPRRMHQVTVLRSAECNILDPEGGLDLPEEILAALDVVHAGLHPYCGYTGEGVRDNTRAMVAAIANPLVDVIVHPGNPSFPVDHQEVAAAAAAAGKALEINNSSFVYTREGSRENCRRIARAVKENEGLISVGSDAHVASFAGEFRAALEVVEEAGITQEQVINFSLETLRGFLASRDKPLFLYSE
ncbi:MAG: phosphatase [Candidatus Geothermincolia bacterium]